jgi:hypothetical protein
MMSRRELSEKQIADLIERFLNSQLAYPQEWNDFIECSQETVQMDRYRKVCYELDPLVNSHEPQDPVALEKLRNLVIELRNQSSE